MLHTTSPLMLSPPRMHLRSANLRGTVSGRPRRRYRHSNRPRRCYRISGLHPAGMYLPGTECILLRRQSRHHSYLRCMEYTTSPLMLSPPMHLRSVNLRSTVPGRSRRRRRQSNRPRRFYILLRIQSRRHRYLRCIEYTTSPLMLSPPMHFRSVNLRGIRLECHHSKTQATQGNRQLHQVLLYLHCRCYNCPQEYQCFPKDGQCRQLGSRMTSPASNYLEHIAC